MIETSFPRLILCNSAKVKTAYCYQGAIEKDPIGDLRFKFATLLTHLSEVFELDMSPDAVVWKTGLGTDLIELHSLIEKNERRFCSYHFSYHFIMVKNGGVIKNHAPELLERFTKELLSCLKISQYRSLRFEIATAAMLVNKKVIFKKRESPDFELINEGQKHYLECTSCYVEKAEFGKQHKLLRVVKKKTKKGYCNPQTALLVDCSNIVASFAKAEELTHEHIDLILAPYLTADRWCAIIFYYMTHHPDAETSEFRYSRFTSSGVNPEQLKMLELLFPGYNPSDKNTPGREVYLTSRLHDIKPTNP